MSYTPFDTIPIIIVTHQIIFMFTTQLRHTYEWKLLEMYDPNTTISLTLSITDRKIPNTNSANKST